MCLFECLSPKLSRWHFQLTPLSKSGDPRWTLNFCRRRLGILRCGAELRVDPECQLLIVKILTHGWLLRLGALPENWETWAKVGLPFETSVEGHPRHSSKSCQNFSAHFHSDFTAIWIFPWVLSPTSSCWFSRMYSWLQPSCWSITCISWSVSWCEPHDKFRIWVKSTLMRFLRHVLRGMTSSEPLNQTCLASTSTTALRARRTEFDSKNGVWPGTTSTRIHPPVFRGKNTACELWSTPELPNRKFTFEGAVLRDPSRTTRTNQLAQPFRSNNSPTSPCVKYGLMACFFNLENSCWMGLPCGRLRNPFRTSQASVRQCLRLDALVHHWGHRFNSMLPTAFDQPGMERMLNHVWHVTLNTNKTIRTVPNRMTWVLTFIPCLAPRDCIFWEFGYHLEDVGGDVIGAKVDLLSDVGGFILFDIRTVWALPLPVPGLSTCPACGVGDPVRQRTTSTWSPRRSIGWCPWRFSLLASFPLGLSLHWPETPGTGSLSHPSTGLLIAQEALWQAWVILDGVYNLILKVRDEHCIFVTLVCKKLKDLLLVDLHGLGLLHEGRLMIVLRFIKLVGLICFLAMIGSIPLKVLEESWPKEPQALPCLLIGQLALVVYNDPFSVIRAQVRLSDEHICPYVGQCDLLRQQVFEHRVVPGQVAVVCFIRSLAHWVQCSLKQVIGVLRICATPGTPQGLNEDLHPIRWSQFLCIKSCQFLECGTLHQQGRPWRQMLYVFSRPHLMQELQLLGVHPQVRRWRIKTRSVPMEGNSEESPTKVDLLLPPFVPRTWLRLCARENCCSSLWNLVWLS